MSPSQVTEDQHARREITGPRPTPLKINKESHLIHKPSSSSSSSSSTSSLANRAAASASKQQGPVIIYTHSPRIIHTQARDFMALVQKLTGLSRSDEDSPAPQPQGQDSGTVLSVSNGCNGNGARMRGREDPVAASSSVLTEENCSVGDVQVCSASSVVPPFDPAVNPFFPDVPLFTPNSSSELFCSSRPMYRYPDPVFSPSNMGSISPSMMEVLKAFPDY